MKTKEKTYKLIDNFGQWILSFNLGDYGFDKSCPRKWVNGWAGYQSTCGSLYSFEKI